MAERAVKGSNNGPDLLATAKTAARLMHQSTHKASPEVGGPAATSLSTALRVHDVRQTCADREVREVPLLKAPE